MSESVRAGDGGNGGTVQDQERLETLGRVLRIRIDGDWDDEMIGKAFDNLERLLFRVDGGENEGDPAQGAGGGRTRRRSGASGHRRGRRS